MDWNVFWIVTSLFGLLGGLTWYLESRYRSGDNGAILLMIISAISIALWMGANLTL